MYVFTGNCRLRAWWKFNLEATIFISFVVVLLLFIVGFVNILICSFIWYCNMLELLILPQDPKSRSSAAKRPRVEIVPVHGITPSIATLLGKRSEGSMNKSKFNQAGSGLFLHPAAQIDLITV